jgi:predicted secreted protein
MHYQPPLQVRNTANQRIIFRLISFLKFLKQKIVLFTCLVIAIGTLLFYLYRSAQYFESSIELFVNSAMTAPAVTSSFSEGNLNTYTSGTVKRVYQIVHSDEMLDKLNRKFDLYGIYNISKEDPFAKGELISKFREDISVRINQYEVVTIAMKDRSDSQRSADMVNFIAEETMQMNRSWYAEQLMQRMVIDSLLSSDMQTTINVEKAFFEKNLAELKLIASQMRTVQQDEFKDVVVNLKMSLQNLEEHASKYSDQIRSNASVLRSMNDGTFREMLIVKKAIPLVKKNQIRPILFWPGIVLISGMITVVIFYLYYIIKRNLKGIRLAE